MTKHIKVKLVHSVISCPPVQRQTVRGLGLSRTGGVRVLIDTPAVRGMVASISHLVEIVEEGSSTAKRVRATTGGVS